jgi:hypothetical protein
VWRQIERYIVGLSAWRAFRYWFWAHFGLILYGMRPFSFAFTVSCVGLAFGSLLLPPEEAPA